LQRSIVFFDLDKTLTFDNLGPHFIKREHQQGYLSYFDVLRLGVWLVIYGMGFHIGDKILASAVKLLKGQQEQDLQKRTREFYEEMVQGNYRPRALEVLEAHREQGERIVMLTASSNYLADLIGRELHFDEILANRFEIDNDSRFSGRPEGQVCYGTGKLVYARKCAQECGISLDVCTFYSDSVSDLPVFEAVGNPVVVHPDRRLLRIAKHRGWRIEMW